MSGHTRKTLGQRVTEDLERQTRVTKRAEVKRDRLKTEADQAETDYQQAEAHRAHLATSPLLPVAPVRRTRTRTASTTPDPQPTTPPPTGQDPT